MKPPAAWGLTVDADGGVVVQAPDGYLLSGVRMHPAGFGSSTAYYAVGMGIVRAPRSDDELTTVTPAGGDGKIATSGGLTGGSFPNNLQGQIWIPGVCRFVSLYANGMGSPNRICLAAELVPDPEAQCAC